MIRSLCAVPAMLCLAAAVVTAQAPAEAPPANAPAAEQPAAQAAAPQPAAQQPTTPRPATPPAPVQESARPAERAAMAVNKVAYTGCVKPGTTTGTWILENAEVAQRAGASTTPSTVGTSGTARMSFNLDPAATIDLKPHANHKVEVVGILSPARSGADATAAPSTSAGAQAAARQQFSVESMKMVSATCP